MQLLERALREREGLPLPDSDAASENVCVCAGLPVAVVVLLVESVLVGVGEGGAVPAGVLVGKERVLGVAVLLGQGSGVVVWLGCGDELVAPVPEVEGSSECVERGLAVRVAASEPTGHTVAVALELVLGVAPILVLGGSDSDALLLVQPVPVGEADDWPLLLLRIVLLAENKVDPVNGPLLVGQTVKVADAQKALLALVIAEPLNTGEYVGVGLRAGEGDPVKVAWSDGSGVAREDCERLPEAEGEGEGDWEVLED